MRAKWYYFAVALVLVCGAGLVFGKVKERDYLGSLYERHDFTLLDDEGEFFRLGTLPAKTLALLVFTPDGIPPETVKPFYEFGRHLDDLRGKGIEPFLVSRTSREIVKNFKHASHFRARLLLDVGGSVGRNAGVWPGLRPVTTWGYALADREFHVLWLATSDQPMAYEQLLEELRRAR
jgi:peroxiredoxin